MLSKEWIILLRALEVTTSAGRLSEEDTAVGDVAIFHQVADAVRDQVRDVNLATVFGWQILEPIWFISFADNLRARITFAFSEAYERSAGAALRCHNCSNSFGRVQMAAEGEDRVRRDVGETSSRI
jgi:hypothetical protein